MASQSSLHTLIDLANKESDEAAKRLGIALCASENAVQKLELLQQYRNDYAERCQTSLASGISATNFNNFRVFMDKLEQAIAGQQKVVADAEERSMQARVVWLACEQKKMSFVTLSGRADKQLLRRENWLDQKQNDEHAARRAQNKPTHS